MVPENECFILETGYWIDKKKSIFKRKEFLPKELLTLLRIKRKNKGIFYSAYRYNNKDQSQSELYGDLYFDFDSSSFEYARQDLLKALAFSKVILGVNYDELQIFFSGSKGFHLIIPANILGIVPCKNLNVTFKHIAKELNKHTLNDTLDMRVYDNKRLFRVPNSIHEKTGLYKTFLTFEEVKTLTEDEIRALAKRPRLIPSINSIVNIKAKNTFNFYKKESQKIIDSFKEVKSNGSLKYQPPCIDDILVNGAVSGQRNNTLAILCSFYRSAGKDLSEALKLVTEWNDEVNGDPISKAELDKTSRSIYQGQRSFGCAMIKELNLCSTSECKFRK